MEQNKEMTPASKARLLLDLLDDEDTLRVFLFQDDIPNRQRGTIMMMHMKFCGRLPASQLPSNKRNRPVADDDDEDADGENTGTPSKRAKPSAPRNPFGRFLKIKDLKLDPTIVRFIKTHGVNARQFLRRSELHNEVEHWAGDDLGDAFLASYHHTIQLKGRMSADRTVWLFLMLQYYDICQIVRPGCSGTRFGPQLMGEISEFLAPILVHNQDPELTLKDTSKHVHEWCKYGSKVNILVSRFGPGCIFLLGEKLSEDFLKTKITASGVRFEEAMNHLERNLKVSAKLKANRLDVLGESIRAFLIRPFKEHAERSAHGGTESDEDDGRSRVEDMAAEDAAEQNMLVSVESGSESE